MSDAPLVVVDGVWKKFRRGERHDSLRDLIPAALNRLFKRSPPPQLEEQEFWAVKDLSFEVVRGEALGVIGPNGAGKSTALKLLTRILKPTRGRCQVRGRVGALIEVAAGFHPDLTGRENVYLQGAIMGMKRADIERRFQDIVDFSGVEAFIDTQVKRYSSGMQARLGFSVAAHLEPDVLFIDEVLSVGDISFQNRCMEKMSEQLRNGVAVVFVSHNLQAVATLCHRAVVLAKGAKIFDGSSLKAIEAYLQATTQAMGRHGSVDSFEMTSLAFEAEGAEATSGAATIKPHARCRVKATVRCLVDSPPCCIGFSIERTADRFYCYGVSSEELGQPLFRGMAGESVTIVVDFVAHLARGHYQVTLTVRDPRKGVFHLYADGAARIVVDETASYDGVVDVEPAIRVSLDQDPASSALNETVTPTW